MRADAEKPEVRAVLVYFAIRTRRAELQQAEAIQPALAVQALPRDYEEALEVLLVQVKANKALEPRAEAFEKWHGSTDCYTLRRVAKDIGWKEGDFRAELINDKVRICDRAVPPERWAFLSVPIQ